MRYDVRCEKCQAEAEIEKPMSAALPRCSECGGPLRRLYTAAPQVHYVAGGFYATDVARFERLVGGERAAKFMAERDDIERRAKAGRLTAYERSLDAPALPHQPKQA